ncbi:MAG: nickel pincer cofactor biosynthesis protein LarC [Candidatus Brocadiia bacterium]
MSQTNQNKRIAHFDCLSGVSGDMLLGALVDAGVPLEALKEALAGLPLEGYQLEAEKVSRTHLAATKVTVRLETQRKHPHRGLSKVLEIVQGGNLSSEVVEDTSHIFRRLAQAEAKVHDSTQDKVHFHEVGAVDAICDITGSVFGLHYLDIETITFGTISLGGGSVEAAHGTLPVPAPAVVELLQGIPTTGGPVNEELTTPTGAAVLSTLGSHSPNWPLMKIDTVGNGAGSRDFDTLPNILRIAVAKSEAGMNEESDRVWIVDVNIDDMTGEEIGFCTEELLSSGALDIFCTPIQMKKNRPGIRLSAICSMEDLERIEEVLWQQTTTLGIRRQVVIRSKLKREIRPVETQWGKVQVKLALSDEAIVRQEPEYEDCARLARENNLPLRRIYRAAREAAQKLET